MMTKTMTVTIPTSEAEEEVKSERLERKNDRDDDVANEEEDDEVCGLLDTGTTQQQSDAR